MKEFILRNEVKLQTKMMAAAGKVKAKLAEESGEGKGLVWALGGIVLTVVVIMLIYTFINNNHAEVEKGIMDKIREVLAI